MKVLNTFQTVQRMEKEMEKTKPIESTQSQSTEYVRCTRLHEYDILLRCMLVATVTTAAAAAAAAATTTTTTTTTTVGQKTAPLYFCNIFAITSSKHFTVK